MIIDSLKKIPCTVRRLYVDPAQGILVFIRSDFLIFFLFLSLGFAGKLNTKLTEADHIHIGKHYGSIKGEEAEEAAELSAGALFMQGVATSIDALSVGFTISEYGWFMALVCSLIVAIVTFFICEAGLAIGKRFGTKLSGKASVLGGVILIGIGLEIFISGMMG